MKTKSAMAVVRHRTMYLETVDSAISNPSLSSSPWMRGAPHNGFPAHPPDKIARLAVRERALLIDRIPSREVTRKILRDHNVDRITVGGDLDGIKLVAKMSASWNRPRCP